MSKHVETESMTVYSRSYSQGFNKISIPQTQYPSIVTQCS